MSNFASGHSFKSHHLRIGEPEFMHVKQFVLQPVMLTLACDAKV